MSNLSSATNDSGTTHIAFRPSKDTESFIRLACGSTWNVTFTEQVEDATAGHHWRTVNEPVWNSLSLLGRDTIIGYARRYDTKDGRLLGPDIIMKTASRQSGRDLGSSIYHDVHGASHPALSEYLAGSSIIDPRRDLLDDTPAQHGITAHIIHGSAPVDDANSHVLHRLMLNPIVRSLWTYTSDLELLRGLRSAVQAHQLLFDQGIMYHDISPQNILLAKYFGDGQPGREGLLLDLDFSLVEGDHRFGSETTHADAIRNIRDGSGHEAAGFVAKIGAIRAGTVQFMAIDMLWALDMLWPFDWNKIIEHSVEYDLESFIWVFAYTVMRRILKVTESLETVKHSTRERLEKDFERAFGSLESVEEIGLSRLNMDPLEFIMHNDQDFFTPYLSIPLRAFLLHLRAIIRAKVEAPAIKRMTTVLRRGGLKAFDVVLTHDWLIGYLDDTILALENDPSLQR